MPKKRILFLMPAMGVGGAEKVLNNLLQLMDYEKYDVDLVVANGGGAYLKEVPAQVNIKSLFEHRAISKLARELYVRFGISLLMKRYAKKISGEYAAGISFLDSVYTDLLFLSPAVFHKRIAVIQSSYASFWLSAKELESKYFLRMKRRYKELDSIVAVSFDSMKEFQSIFNETADIQVIYNPISFKRVKELAVKEPEVRLNPEVTNLVAVGRLTPVKGYEMLIDSCTILKDRGVDFNLYIVGAGQLEKKLGTLVNDHDLGDRVFITGFLKNAYAVMNSADIFVMTSYSEGLPTSLCEAMVLEKPVMVTNVPGCSEVVDHGKYGMIVEPEKHDIAKGISELIANPRLREKYSGLSSKRSLLFNDDVVLKEYYSIIEG